MERRVEEVFDSTREQHLQFLPSSVSLLYLQKEPLLQFYDLHIL